MLHLTRNFWQLFPSNISISLAKNRPTLTMRRAMIIVQVLKHVFPSVCRYLAMTVTGLQVIDGKATELNFTLAPAVNEAARNDTLTTTTVLSTNHPAVSTTNSSNSTQTLVVPSEGNKSSPPLMPPVHQSIQPQEFRHHDYADMELFLRKYSSEFPTITHLYSIGRSVDNRELYVMVISDNPSVHEHGKSFFFFFFFSIY